MSNNKSLQQIKDEEAQKLGWDDFRDLELTLGTNATFGVQSEAQKIYDSQPKEEQPEKIVRELKAEIESLKELCKNQKQRLSEINLTKTK